MTQQRTSSSRAVPGVVVGGRYALRTAIGHGGMGTVWRATDTLLRRDVAVKEVLLPPAMPPGERDALCERTLREARAAAALSHPSVVQVYDVVTDEDRPWIVMELLEARSLADMVIDDGPLAQRAVAKIAIAMLGALEVAHAAGVLHRDVKPANVLICTDGRCVLTDFGVARLPAESNLTTPGMVLGSPHFISPERAIGSAFGPPSDLFSLGVTLFTAVEGTPPFDKGDPFETMRAVVEEPPQPTRLAGPLSPILYGLLEKDPARRWTVGQSRSALRELLNGQLSRSTPAHPDTDPYAVVRPAPAPPPPPAPTGQVGGRAMLAPNESLSGHLAKVRQAGTAPEMGMPTEEWVPDAGYGYGPQTGYGPPPGYGPDGYQPDGYQPMARNHRARRGVTKSQLILAGGLVAILGLVALAGFAGWFSGSDPGKQQALPTASVPATDPALIPTQAYKDQRGITVNVPAGWRKSGANSYVDFADPENGARKVRINVEKGTNAKRFLEVAERGLKSKTCKEGYARVGLRDQGVELSGQPAAELEYTCGKGEELRHGIWRAVVVDGTAYHFYLTAPDSQFDDSKVVFDEMVRSFQLSV